ncbi:MAG TPA: hypothetical protein VNG71_09945 [Pyrinomonadaceae bacterium]|nr:hypothetical protein [Pyrinomonadaceae bacterium]
MAGTLGKVYIYNLFNEPATLTLNGGPAGTIDGWNSDPAKGYQPSFIAVDSAKHFEDGPGKVYRGEEPNKVGENSISVTWADGVATGNVKFPTDNDNVRITDDLVCFIAKNNAFVETTEGFVIGGDQILDFNASD